MTHLPVMFAEALQQLAIKEDGVYLDCTFGRGGHSQGILNQLGENGRLLAFDRDLDAVNSDYAQAMLKDKRFTLKHSCFSELENTVANEGLVGQIDGILIDLGVSSPQLDNPERGFSFLRDGPLDMRMDGSSGVSAEQWLATVDEAYLVKILFEYGEEKFSRRVAKAVVETRAHTPITTTRQLAELCENAIPMREKHKHPATRTFQAIRIEINRELDELKDVLQQAVRVLKPEGRLVVISFHSLEDRIVKRFIKNESGAKYNPSRLPIKEVDMAKGLLKKVSKALTADAQEVAQNPRSRSAVMRVAQRVA
ncbi:MAG: 16S rRNA (cytosine(1402)-N(4))-methyltransferase RsmH [Methylococcales bacterium]|nr:16S rRNA (cytosine(1402)-N(4))-methyltransferase RsmH [Methylococcales bacterium]